MPLIISAPLTQRIFPFSVLSTASSLTQVSPREFGRNGERVAKTPTRLFPPRRGGLTVGDHSPKLPEKPHISHRCEYCSISLMQFSSRNSGVNTIFDIIFLASPL